MEQTYPDWELCLADDGSNDAASRLSCRQSLQRDSRIRVVTPCSRTAASPAPPMQRWRLSTGEYVAFLDHDDELAACLIGSGARHQ